MNNLYRPKFSYIIPFRFKPDRVIPLRRVIDWLSGYQGIEIIIVEQDKHSKISNLNLKANHIFIESEAPFNKSWAYNVAIKRANSPIIVFGDSDFLMHPNELIESLKELERCDCVIPTSNIIKLNPQESNIDFGNIFQIKRPSMKMCMTDGISIFKKESIQKIGGWNEDFLGLGYSNKFQDMKITKMLNFKQMDFYGYHLHHSTENVDMGLMQRNQQILDYYTNPQADLNSHINLTVPKIGFLNKYQF
jgi:glycosyltransferase involved in cell wall biosynthesis